MDGSAILERNKGSLYWFIIRVIQYILIFLRYWYSIFSISSLFWYFSTYSIALDIIFYIFQSWIIYYCFINLFTWHLLMNHIEVMSQLRNGIQYQEWNKQIKRKEIKLFIFWIIIILLWILFYIFLPIFSNLTQTINENSDLIDTVENAFLYLAWLIFWSILFIKLSKILKNYLNYYFINNWKRIWFIFLISFALFIWTIASIMTKFIFDINESKMIGNTWSYEDYARVLFLLLSLSVNIWRTLCNR